MSSTVQHKAAVNVDVDGLYLYDRIHGHSGSSGNEAGFDPATADPTVWTRGVTRFLDLFDRVGVRATFFVVAQDLAQPDVRAVLSECVAAGHEVGNHSLSHPYDLSRLDADQMRVEVAEARARLEDFCGCPVVGFRAPGYVLSEALLEVVAEAGHTYDSSRFPCPPYQAAKALAIAWYRLRGRPSGSIPESPAVWLGRSSPYLETLADGGTLVELPIAVLPGGRMPMIGTSLITFGNAGYRLMQPLVRRAPWLNFECHAIDLTDHEGDSIAAHLRVQPEQRVPLSTKWPLMMRMLEDLVLSHEVRTLADWAAVVSAADDLVEDASA